MTLIELLVAVALLGTVAVLSAQLVIQGTRLIDTSARASRNPDLVLAGDWLRRDLYEATAVVGGEGWNDGPLVAVTQSGGRISFSPIEGRLIRSDVVPGSSSPDSRAIMTGLVGWRWRIDGGALIRVEIKSLANPHAHRGLTGTASPSVERRTERLSFALRGAPGGTAW